MFKKLLVSVFVFMFIASMLAGCVNAGVQQTSEVENGVGVTQEAPSMETAQDISEGENAEETPTYILRFDHGTAETDVRHTAILQMAENVKERTNGDLVIEVYSGLQLGTTEDMFEQARQGTNVGCMGDPGRLAVYVTGLAAVAAPYVVENYDEVQTLASSELMKRWVNELTQKYDLVPLSWNWCQGSRSVFSTKPASTIQEMGKLRLRAANAPVWQEMVKTVGAIPVAMEFSEIYSGAQTKLVDGCEMNLGNIYSGQLYEVLKYMIETRHNYLFNCPVVGAEWFNSLPKEYQDILIEESNKAGEFYTQGLEALEQDYMKTFKENGMTVIPFEELPIDAFKANAETSYEVLGVSQDVEKVKAVLGK